LRSVPIRDASGHVVKWYGTNSDIHDLRVAVDKRKEAVDRLLNLLENVSEPFLALSDGVTGKRLLQVVPESAVARFRESLHKVAHEGRETSFDARFAGVEGDGGFTVRVFPSAEGIAVFFERQQSGDRRTAGESPREG
jgi:hypothetical protein